MQVQTDDEKLISHKGTKCYEINMNEHPQSCFEGVIKDIAVKGCNTLNKKNPSRWRGETKMATRLLSVVPGHK